MSTTEFYGTGEKEAAVAARYSQAAKKKEPALCCAVDYSSKFLEVISDEILQVDYGCGDPTAYVDEGDTVLDLGSGSGKTCYILAQVVGPSGRVIGVDCNPEMLALSRKHRETIADRLGYSNVDFRCGMIQDLQLDIEVLLEETSAWEMRTPNDWLEFRRLQEQLRRESPLVSDESIDCVVSNCVLNLVRPEDRTAMFSEIFRVLKRGGRAAVSDIIADKDVPEHLQKNPELWSGCVSGAHREDKFLGAFEDAGFHGIQIVTRQQQPWQTVEGIGFRSMTVLAYKGKQGPCLERNQALIYRGPFRQVEDDDGHVFRRGQRVAVCDKTFHLLQQKPYETLFEPIEPRESTPIEEAQPFDCRREALRSPGETNGESCENAESVQTPSGGGNGNGKGNGRCCC